MVLVLSGLIQDGVTSSPVRVSRRHVVFCLDWMIIAGALMSGHVRDDAEIGLGDDFVNFKEYHDFFGIAEPHLSYPQNVLSVHGAPELWSRFDLALRNVEYFRHGIDDDTYLKMFVVALLAHLDNDDARLFGVRNRFHPELQSKLDHRDDLSSKVDHTFDVFWRLWQRCDVDDADDLSNFEDLDAVFLVHETKREKLVFILVLALGELCSQSVVDVRGHEFVSLDVVLTRSGGDGCCFGNEPAYIENESDSSVAKYCSP